MVGTGGFGRLFEEERLFDEFVPELPLIGSAPRDWTLGLSSDFLTALPVHSVRVFDQDDTASRSHRNATFGTLYGSTE